MKAFSIMLVGLVATVAHAAYECKNAPTQCPENTNPVYDPDYCEEHGAFVDWKCVPTKPQGLRTHSRDWRHSAQNQGWRYPRVFESNRETAGAIFVGLACASVALAQLSECNLDKNPHFREIKIFLREGMDEELFSKNGKTSKKGYLGYIDPASDDGSSFCFQSPDWKRERANCGTFQNGDNRLCAYCFPPSDPDRNKPFRETAMCTYRNLNAKARFRLTPVDYRNCVTNNCKYTASDLKTKKVEVHGEIKASGTLFGKLGLEATVGGSCETTHTYQTTEEQTLAKDESAFLVGVTVELVTNIEQIAISASNATTWNAKKNEYDSGCIEDKFISTVNIPNNYFLRTKQRVIWLKCILSKSPPPPQKEPYYPPPEKRQLQGDPVDEDECFYLDSEGNLVSEPCQT
ncbi:unnamed protein product [Mortierella alpina]